MKLLKLIFPLLLVVICVSSYSSTGSAIIPFMEVYFPSNSRYNMPVYQISNASDQTVTVDVIIFEDNGAIITDGDDDPAAGVVRAYQASSYSDSGTSYTARFILAPYHTTRVNLRCPTTKIGFGRIEWESSADLQIALVAEGYIESYRDEPTRLYFAKRTIQINKGQPF